jgi:adenine-specific DNA-methyltransferase
MSHVAIRTIDAKRLEANARLDPTQKSKLGQFMTPSAIAEFMASLFTRWPSDTRLLDPGAGIGSLTDAFAEQFFKRAPLKAQLHIATYEIEPVLLTYLREHLEEIRRRGANENRQVAYEIIERDFITEATFGLGFGADRRFSHAILNPPYKKINTNSEHRKSLSRIGIETVNLYTAFFGLAVELTEQNGEIVAIIPRSFCNGTYFRPFREWLLARAAIRHLHIFDSRSKAFKDDEVLQENIIIYLVRDAKQGEVVVSTSHDQTFADYKEICFPFSAIVKPDNVERFIHIPTIEVNGGLSLCSHTLQELGLEVSTGPVVDFRVRSHWRKDPGEECVPLLYPHHFANGGLNYPAVHKKPNALAVNEETRKWLMPQGCYTLVKRFSAKEERRRVVAFVLDPKQLQFDFYGFENHFNVIHAKKHGIPADLAHGLALFLNSTLLDRQFRLFSGHTQVNATDLRTMKYPDRTQLMKFGKWAQKQQKLTQDAIDAFIENQ